MVERYLYDTAVKKFKVIKNDLDIRAVNHRKKVRVKGHVYICVLAYFITIAIEYIAMNKKLNKSSRKILRQLSQISLLDIKLTDGKKKYSITTVQREHKKILNAYKIKKVEVPKVVLKYFQKTAIHERSLSYRVELRLKISFIRHFINTHSLYGSIKIASDFRLR